MDDLPPSLPESNSSPSASASAPSEEDGDTVDMSHLPDEHRDTMRRLHRRVEAAAETIERLREENRQLRERVDELEARPSFPEDESVLTFDDDPDELRAQITEFIDAIDTYLETTPSADEDVSSNEDAAASSPEDSEG